MSIAASPKASLYGLLVAEIARVAAQNEPIQLTSEGKFVDRKQTDKAEVGRKGSVFCHNFTSAFERASFVLWALEIAQPVKQTGAHWTIDHAPGSMTPYYQLQHDIDSIAAVAANEVSRIFPSLDYVLSTYLDGVEQSMYLLVEFAKVLNDSSEWDSEKQLKQVVGSMLPDGYTGARAELPAVFESSVPRLATLLERAGYVASENGHLAWTEAAAPALRGDWYALQGGDVSIDDGRPRLRLRH
jgi:hypothetical protein